MNNRYTTLSTATKAAVNLLAATFVALAVLGAFAVAHGAGSVSAALADETPSAPACTVLCTGQQGVGSIGAASTVLAGSGTGTVGVTG